MEIKRAAIYGRKHPERFQSWFAEHGVELVCYIDDIAFDVESGGVPILNLEEFLEGHEDRVDAIFVNHTWDAANSNAYFEKLGRLKKPLLWNLITMGDVSDRLFEHSGNLFTMHVPHGLHDLTYLPKFVEKFGVGRQDFSELLASRYDTIEPHTLAILLRAYELCEKELHAGVNSIDLALEYAGIYANVLTKKRGLPSPDEYCYGEIRPRKGHRVISAGGDIGHEIPEFLGKIGRDGKIVIFEVSRSSVAFLTDKFRGYPRIEIANKALHSSSGTMEFFESVDDPGAGTVVAERQDGRCGRYMVESVSLDEYMSGGGLPGVDYIKMDIEGAEYEALIGATNTLNTFKPMLSICVYHANPLASGILEEDILRIPDLLRRIAPGYKLHLVNTELTPWGGMKLFGIHEGSL